MPAILLLILYLALTLSPLALAWGQGLPPRGLWDEIASGLALTGFAILLVEFVLSGRFRSVSSRIGLDVTMRYHQLLARTAAVFLLLHPFLYRTPFGIALPHDPTGQLRLNGDAGTIAAGALAWLLLFVLVLTAMFRRKLPYRYESWRIGHAAGAVLLVLLAAYHTIFMGRYSAAPWLAGFWLLLLTLALCTLAFVYLVKPFAKRRHPYAVRSVRPIAERIWELAIEPAGPHALSFKAGQFVWLTVGHSPFSPYENPFSIASAPGQREVRFVIKESGDFTGSLDRIAPGTTAYLDGPHGNLTLDRHAGAKGIALIAGGVGIAPMLSHLRALAAAGDGRPVILLYGNRVAEQIVYREELAALSESLDLRIELVLSDPPTGWTGRTGMLDTDTVSGIFRSPDAGDWVYLLCGPPAMMKAAETGLLSLGVPGRHILAERFDYD